ncbi:4-phytase [Intrasporangium chromatireducens Q5-1]|uniref:4-phytase n=1 Tax=Intrasporangium chromatireducens Q5-1 TaxID=584657 RepID=W9GN67_9MICO|nr:ABC transporter substrate-binding protein [Intrasporangium chromatireducens]EWT06502.1 4-phytase [Intrasporangium chromatireducens Q5-1]
MTKPGLRLAIGATAAALLLASCGGGAGGSNSPSAGATDGSGSPGGSFTVASSEPDHLTPGNSWSFYLESLMFTGPLTIDAQTGETRPGAAESVTSSDQKVWTIKLKPGQKFSNGEPVTADTFVSAWNATALGSNAWAQNSNFALFEGYADLNPAQGEPKTKSLSGVKVIDENTIEVTLTKAFGLFPYVIASYAFAPLPKAAFDDPKAFDSAPIGNGPYQIQGKHEPNKPITLVRNKSFQGTAGKADSITFKPYTSYGTAYNDLLAGNTDIVYPVPADRLGDAETRLKGRTAVATIPNLNYFAFPSWDKRFHDVRIRQAFSMAIDRDALTKSILKGSGEPARSIAPSSAVGATENACSACAYDPAKAKQLLDEAGGWTGPLKLYATQYETNDQILQAVANQLRTNLGIKDISFETPPYAQLDEKVKGKKIDGPFLYYWGAYFPHVGNFLQPLLTKDGIANDTGYTNAEFEKLVNQADSSPIEQGLPLYAQAEKLAWQDMPIAPLYYGRFTAAWTKNVTNVPVGVNGLGDLGQVSVVKK